MRRGKPTQGLVKKDTHCCRSWARRSDQVWNVWTCGKKVFAVVPTSLHCPGRAASTVSSSDTQLLQPASGNPSWLLAPWNSMTLPSSLAASLTGVRHQKWKRMSLLNSLPSQARLLGYKYLVFICKEAWKKLLQRQAEVISRHTHQTRDVEPDKSIQTTEISCLRMKLHLLRKSDVGYLPQLWQLHVWQWVWAIWQEQHVIKPWLQ